METKTTKTLNTDQLKERREYLVKFNSGEALLLFYMNGEFYDGHQEFPVCKLNEVESVEESPNFDKKIFIFGTYGDPTVLYLNGWVHTKYGDTLKIKSVNIENKHVECFGDSFDFSRVSSSEPNSEQAKKSYLETTKRYLYEINKLRVGTKLKLISDNKDNDSNEIERTVTSIEEPNCIDNYSFTIHFNTGEPVTYNKYLNFETTHVPYTREEEIENIINDNCEFGGKIKDKSTLIGDLIAYFDLENETKSQS